MPIYGMDNNDVRCVLQYIRNNNNTLRYLRAYNNFFSMTRKQIESLDYIELGSGWYSNEDDTMRIRLWRKDELDIYKWRGNDDSQIIFRGTIKKIKDFELILTFLST